MKRLALFSSSIGFIGTIYSVIRLYVGGLAADKNPGAATNFDLSGWLLLFASSIILLISCLFVLKSTQNGSSNS